MLFPRTLRYGYFPSQFAAHAFGNFFHRLYAQGHTTVKRGIVKNGAAAQQHCGNIVLQGVEQLDANMLLCQHGIAPTAIERRAQFAENSFNSADTKIDEDGNGPAKVVDEKVGLSRLDFSDPLVHQHRREFFRLQGLATKIKADFDFDRLLKRTLDGTGAILSPLRRPDEKYHAQRRGKRRAKFALLQLNEIDH